MKKAATCTFCVFVHGREWITCRDCS